MSRAADIVLVYVLLGSYVYTLNWKNYWKNSSQKIVSNLTKGLDFFWLEKESGTRKWRKTRIVLCSSWGWMALLFHSKLWFTVDSLELDGPQR